MVVYSPGMGCAVCACQVLLLIATLLGVQAYRHSRDYGGRVALRHVSRAGREFLKVWLDLAEGDLEKLSPLVDSLPPYISESCIHAVEEVFHNDPHVFIRMLDAWGKPGGGILNGNTMWLGSYDECSRLQNASFCIFQVLLGDDEGVWSGVLTKEVAIFSAAMCVPVECDGADVKNAVDAVLLSRLGSINPFGDVPVRPEVKCSNFGSEPLTPGAIVVICLCCLIVFTVAVATLCDAVFRVYGRQELTVESKSLNPDVDQLEKTPLLPRSLFFSESHSRRKKMMWRLCTCLKESAQAFSLYHSLSALLNTKRSPTTISCADGIRVISLCWYIAGHTLVWLISGNLLDNGLEFMRVQIPQVFAQLIVQGFFSVDSFFFISGLLVAYLTLQEMSFRAASGLKWRVFPFVSYYVYRYFRLTIVYGLVLLFFIQMLPYLGYGPVWSAVDKYAEDCREYWWTNLLYINNIYPSFTNQCISGTWYLSADMQFYAISPLLLIPLFLYWPLGLSLTTALLLACMLVTGVLTGVYNLGLSPFQGVLVPDMTLSHWVDILPPFVVYNNVYFDKPYCRIPPYLVGLLVGFVLYRELKLPFRWTLSAVLHGGSLVCALVLTSVLILGLYPMWHGHVYTVTEEVLFNVLSRLAWGVALAFVVYACHNGYGGWLNSGLSWSFWTPLARLCFLTFLIHPIVLFATVDSLQRTLHCTYVNVIVLMVGEIALSFGIAFAVSAVVEYPLKGVLKAVFKCFGVERQFQSFHRLPQSDSIR